MEKNISKFPNVSEVTKNAYIKNNLEFKMLMAAKKKEKQMIANLIENYLNVNNIVEFCDVYYKDSETLIPTIAGEFAKDDKTAKIITTCMKSEKLDNLTIINTSNNNPYGVYEEIITPNNLKLIKEAECFVTTSYLPRLKNHFKAWAGMGIPCIYAVSGSLNKDTKKKDDEIRKNMEEMKGQFIDLESNFKYDKDTNTFAKIYILKR